MLLACDSCAKTIDGSYLLFRALEYARSAVLTLNRLHAPTSLSGRLTFEPIGEHLYRTNVHVDIAGHAKGNPHYYYFGVQGDKIELIEFPKRTSASLDVLCECKLHIHSASHRPESTIPEYLSPHVTR